MQIFPAKPADKPVLKHQKDRKVERRFKSVMEAQLGSYLTRENVKCFELNTNPHFFTFFF